MAREGAIRWRVVDHGPDGTHVLLYGDLVEDVAFTPLLEQLAGPEVTLDLAGVRRVNSVGVRELVGLFGAIRGRRRLVLERCSPAVVNQLNMLPELGEDVLVRSALAPMECPRCLSEQEHLVDLGRGARSLSLVCVCDGCGAEMDLAEPRDRYFAFLGVQA